MARRRVARRLQKPKSHEGGAPDRLPYACYYLCNDCGWLEEPRYGHPHRRADEACEPGDCPSCGKRAWIDLQRQSLALAYREAEATDETMSDESGQRRGLWLGVVASMLAVAAMGSWMPAGSTMHPVFFTVVALLTWLAVGWLVARLTRRARPRVDRPRRWRRPLPRPHRASATAQVRHGVVEGDTILRAPVSGVPCLGWAVQVWSDAGLLLDEQHHAALTVEGETFIPDGVTLDLAPRGGLHPSATDEAFVRFMRRRGLSPHDTALRVYESHLMPGVPVALHWHRDPKHAGPVLSQAPRSLG